MTPSTRRRIVRHLERAAILYPDDHPTIVANVIRAWLQGLQRRRERRIEERREARTVAWYAADCPPTLNR